MPIRLNLLAEAKAAEEQRRRDPVKRAIWLGATLVSLMLAVSSYLQLRSTIAKGELSRVEGQLGARTNEYRQVLTSQRKLSEVKEKLAALNQLATNRFLNGTLLNALQQTTIDDVQLIRLRTEQSYALIEAVKPKTNDDERITPGKPATATEHMQITLDATDGSANPGDQVNRFKEAVITNRFFRRTLVATNAISLKNLSAPQISPATGKACVLFTLEAHCPDKTR